MKKLILFSLVSLSVSSSFAAHLVCNHGHFSPMIIDVQTDGSKALVKVLKTGNAEDSSYPQVGEHGILTPQEAAKGWTILATSEGVKGRGFQLNILTADLAKSSFRAVLAATVNDYSTTTWSTFELTCERK